MEDRNSFRGFGITDEFVNRFKASKFYKVIYQEHTDEIIVGVRDGYICLYYNCDCIAKIEPSYNLTAQIDPYYTNGQYSSLTDDEMVELFSLIKQKSDERKKREKQAQQRLYIQNNNSLSSEWFCIDVEYTKSLRGKSRAEDWRFDIIAISKSKPHKIALIELKYGAGALGEPSGIRTHVKDFYSFHVQDSSCEFSFGELKQEVVSMISKLDLLGVSIPEELAEVDGNKISDSPEYYFITLNNNPAEEGKSLPKQTMSGYLFGDKRWNCQRISKLVKEEGDYFTLIHNDKTFVPKFLFSNKCLPDFTISDIINDDSYEQEIIDVSDKTEIYSKTTLQSKERTQTENDTLFKRKCRIHQSWFREKVLKLGMGVNPRTHRAVNETEEDFLVRRQMVEDINHLTDTDASLLMNFVPSFHEEIRNALIGRYGKVPVSHDLMNDMLRSANIPWNIFVPMFQDKDAAICVLRKLTNRNNIKEITGWKIEYNPNTLGDNTAFDAFVQYRTVEGNTGIIGIEVKYTEEGYKVHKKEQERIDEPKSSYSIVTRDSHCFIETNTEQFNTREYIQIWRNHMLAISMGTEYECQYDSVTIYPSGNTHFHSANGRPGALEQYMNMLTDKGKSTFHYTSFEELFNLFDLSYNGERHKSWIDYLKARYIVDEDEIECNQHVCTSYQKDNRQHAAENIADVNPNTSQTIEVVLDGANQEWVLNLVDYSLDDMLSTSKVRARFTNDAPIASRQVSTEKYYSLDQFKKAYNQERGSTHDNKNAAYWYFCRSVKIGDVIYLAKGPALYGYAVVKGNEVITDETTGEHSWKVEWHKYDKEIAIDANIATPFFVNLQVQKDKMIRLHKAIEKH